MDELYQMLEVATGLEALSVEQMWNLTGNTPFERLLRLLRAPNLSQLDVKIVVPRDWSALLMCGDLVQSVVMLRIYSVRRPEVDFKKLDMGTADESLAQSALKRGFRWTRLDTLHMRTPQYESVRTIISAVTVANLHVHYRSPSHSLGQAGSRWISSRVGDPFGIDI
ncbi:hypothetical protein B0H14DRAFT_2564256 [Mycena olivaceomarginata]|nr:hypothetical protein B0H14DRAFT_2564256 [Mycena olivaceomarginata]